MSFLVNVIDYLEQGGTELFGILQIVFDTTSESEIINACEEMIFGDSTSLVDVLNSQLPAVLAHALDNLV